MNASIVSKNEPVALIGGGPVSGAVLGQVLTHCPTLVAADSGADRALGLDQWPDAVIGDMDSLSDVARDRLTDRLHLVSEQDSTDFDKALRHIAAPLVLAVGFSGGRLDHELAVMNALVRHSDRPCIVVGAETLVFHCPAHLRLDLAAGDLVSLFPMRQVTTRSTGLEWDVTGRPLAPDALVGTSNRALGPVDLRPDRDGLLVILETGALGQAIAALTGPSPVRA